MPSRCIFLLSDSSVGVENRCRIKQSGKKFGGVFHVCSGYQNTTLAHIFSVGGEPRSVALAEAKIIPESCAVQRMELFTGIVFFGRSNVCVFSENKNV